MMWIRYNDSGNSVGSLEEGIKKLFEIKEKYPEAYLEFDGKRLHAQDVEEGLTEEEASEKMVDITFEEYIADFESVIENTDGDYSSFEMASDIKDIPDPTMRMRVMVHYIDRFLGVPYFTDYVAETVTVEERKELLEVYKENGIDVNRKIFYPKIWVVPSNDLEAKKIIEMLEFQGEHYVVTKQGWGASWENLEPEVFEQIKEKGFELEDEHIEMLREYDEEIQEISSQIAGLDREKDEEKIKALEEEKGELTDKRQGLASDFLFSINRQAYEKGMTVYGVELTGNSRGGINIDHHGERSSEDASIEQVARVLGIHLTIDEMFVAANDKAFIPGMEKLGKEFGMLREDVTEIILNIRRKDRAVQGITLEQEEQSRKAIAKLGDLSEKREYILVDDLPHSKSATITDELYGKYDNLLVASQNGETNFFGSTEIIDMLESKFRVEDPKTGYANTWKGGQLEEGNGFWGSSSVSQDAIKKAVSDYFEAKNKNNVKDVENKGEIE